MVMGSAFWEKKLVTIASWSLLELEAYYPVLIHKCVVLK